jgi:hypothetical protein
MASVASYYSSIQSELRKYEKVHAQELKDIVNGKSNVRLNKNNGSSNPSGTKNQNSTLLGSMAWGAVHKLGEAGRSMYNSIARQGGEQTQVPKQRNTVPNGSQNLVVTPTNPGVTPSTPEDNQWQIEDQSNQTPLGENGNPEGGEVNTPWQIEDKHPEGGENGNPAGGENGNPAGGEVNPLLPIGDNPSEELVDSTLGQLPIGDNPSEELVDSTLGQLMEDATNTNATTEAGGDEVKKTLQKMFQITKGALSVYQNIKDHIKDDGKPNYTTEGVNAEFENKMLTEILSTN